MAFQDEVSDLCQACCDLAKGVTIETVRNFVIGVERKVPLHDGRQRVYVNLDNAATTPPLESVLKCSQMFLEWYGSVHRGSGLKAQISTHAFERCREVVAEFIGADLGYHTVIFTQNATHALNKLAMHLGPAPDKVILTTVMEHHSNMLPWRKLGCEVHYVRVQPENGTLDMADLEDHVRRYAGRIAVVAVTGASNVTGVMPPIRRIARIAHQAGAQMVVDATQLIPHRPFKMGAPDDPERIDFIAFSGHKMYAPFGAGVLAGPAAAFEERDPDYVGGGTVQAVTMDEVHWAPIPEKEEAGTPNVLGCLAIGCVIKVLESIGMENLAEHERTLTRRAVEKLRKLDGLTLYGLTDPEVGEDRLGVITMNARDYSHGQLSAILGHEWGIGVRNGCFCAQPYVRELLGISDAQMHSIVERLTAGDHATVPGMVRFSFGVYNTPDEVDYAVEALRAVLASGPKARYLLDRQHMEYVPETPSFSVRDLLPI